MASRSSGSGSGDGDNRRRDSSSMSDNRENETAGPSKPLTPETGWATVMHFLKSEKERMGISKPEEVRRWYAAIATLISFRSDEPLRKRQRLDDNLTPPNDEVAKRRRTNEETASPNISELEALKKEKTTLESAVAKLEAKNKSLEGTIDNLQISAVVDFNCIKFIEPSIAERCGTADGVFTIPRNHYFKETLPERPSSCMSRQLLLYKRLKTQRFGYYYKMENKSRFTEVEFIELMDKDSVSERIIYVYGEKNAGKTTLLTEIGRQLSQKGKQKLVVIFSASDFMNELKRGDITDKGKAIVKTFENLLCTNELGRKNLAAYFREKKKVYFELILHHLESLGQEELKLIYEVVNEAVKFKSVRVWLSSTLEPDATLDCAKITIVPLSKKDLATSLVEYWKNKLTNIEIDTIVKFTDALLGDMDVTEVEGFVPVSIQFLMISEGFEAELAASSSTGIVNAIPAQVEKAIMWLADNFVRYRLIKYHEENAGARGRLEPDDNWDIHRRLGFQVTFPDADIHLNNIFEKPNTYNEKEILKAGLVEMVSGRPKFLHSCISQFFVADYTSGWMTGEWPEVFTTEAVKCNLLKFYFEKFFEISPEGEVKQGMIPKILDNMIGIELAKEECKVGELLNKCENIEFETIRKFLVNCTTSGWVNIYRLFLKTKAFIDHSDKLMETGFFTDIIKDKDVDIVKTTLKEGFSRCLKHLKLNQTWRLKMLEAALKRGIFSIMKLLIRKGSSGFDSSTKECAQFLLTNILHKSPLVPSDEATLKSFRIPLLNLIHKSSPKLLEVKSDAGETILFQERIHPILFKELIRLGGDAIFEKDLNGKTFLHKIFSANYSFNEFSEYLSIIKEIPEDKLKRLISLTSSFGDTPYELFKTHGISIFTDGIMGWFKEMGAGLDVTGQDPVVLQGIKLGVNADVLKLMIKYGGKLHWTDGRRQTLLHFAAQLGNADAVAVLVDAGVNVNALNVDGETPLDQCRKGAQRDSKECKTLEAIKSLGGKSGLEMQSKRC